MTPCRDFDRNCFRKEERCNMGLHKSRSILDEEDTASALSVLGIPGADFAHGPHAKAIVYTIHFYAVYAGFHDELV